MFSVHAHHARLLMGSILSFPCCVCFSSLQLCPVSPILNWHTQSADRDNCVYWWWFPLTTMLRIYVFWQVTEVVWCVTGWAVLTVAVVAGTKTSKLVIKTQTEVRNLTCLPVVTSGIESHCWLTVKLCRSQHPMVMPGWVRPLLIICFHICELVIRVSWSSVCFLLKQWQLVSVCAERCRSFCLSFSENE